MVTATDILNAKILIVDDKEANVRLLEGMLRVAGYTCVRSTMDPNEVCDLHRENHYSLILLDLHLPDLPGSDVLRILKSGPETASIPVAMITADATPGQIDRLMSAGARAYFTKPLDVKRLLQFVDEALEVAA